MRQNRHCLVILWKCQNVYFASWGKSTPTTILPSTNHIWLKAKQLQWCFASWGKIKIHYFPWADQDYIRLRIFKNFANQDWIGVNFIGSGLDSDWKISQSTHLWCVGLSCYRCHGQLSKTCVPNLSCDYFSQLCLAKGKIAPVDSLPNKAK